MTAQQRMLLEQLMGSGERDVPRNLMDPHICRPYCSDFCVRDLFAGTKKKLKPCPKYHVERLRLQYRARSEPIPEFEAEFVKQLEEVVALCDAEIQHANKQLQKIDADAKSEEVLQKVKAEEEALAQLETEIVLMEVEIKALGEVAMIDDACLQLSRLDRFMNRREARKKTIASLHEQLNPSAHQKLQVCSTCGALLSSLDTDRRLADHFIGKLHTSYARVRDALAKRTLKKSED